MNTDPRYATNEARCKRRHEIDEIVGNWIGSRDREDLLQVFEREGITAAPLYNISDISEDRHFVERGIYVEVPDDELGEVAMHSPMPELSVTPGTIRTPAPEIGQHTYEILGEIGLDVKEIEKLIANESVRGRRK